MIQQGQISAEKWETVRKQAQQPVVQLIRLDSGTISNLFNALTTGNAQAVTREEARQVIVYVQSEGYDKLQAVLRIAAEKSLEKQTQTPATEASVAAIYQPETDKLTATLENAGEKKTTICLVLPAQVGESFTANFLNVIGRTNSVETVATVGQMPKDLVGKLRDGGVTIRPVKNLSRPITVVGQDAVPAGLLTDVSGKLNEMFLPFTIDMTEADQDPLIRDYVEQLQIVALIHTARIISQRPELLKKPAAELKGELLKQLALFEDYDSIIEVSKPGERMGFTIKAAVAQAYLAHQAELSVQRAA